MCLILDADRYGEFLDPGNTDMEPVRHWIKKNNGKIVYAATEKMQDELSRFQSMKRLFSEYRQAGRLKLFDKEKVKGEENEVRDLLSNDKHIIALAMVSGVKLLISGDKKLQGDFKKIVRGKIYKNKSHKHLLRQDTCP